MGCVSPVEKKVYVGKSVRNVGTGSTVFGGRKLLLQGLNRSVGGSDAIVVENSCEWFSDTFNVW